MPVSYEKLLAVLKARNISKTQMGKDIGLSSVTLAKFANNQPVSMEVLERLCRYLALNPDDLISFAPEKEVNELMKRLTEEKNNSVKGGIYHEMQVIMTYNSNHIEGSKLTEDQTRYIFETSTLLPADSKGVHVDDIVETVNHFACIRFVIDHVYDPLSESLIKNLHRILKSGTKDASLDWFMVGEYKKIPNIVGGNETIPPDKVQREMQSLLGKYALKDVVSFKDIVAFHHDFEIIHPFQDGNGRVGRLIAFKECLRYGYVPFIIDDEIKAFYYRGLNEWKNQPGFLLGTCETGQDKMKKLMDYFLIKY